MELKERIKSNLEASLKSGDVVTRGVLRLLNSDIKNKEIEFKRELNNNEIVDVIKSGIKKRKDSIEQYRKAKREDLAVKEERELKILEKYMPEQMSEEKVRVLVKEVIKELGVFDSSDFGKAMKEAMQRVKGMADGKIVNRIVREELEKIGN